MEESHYKLFKETRTWTQARQLCMERGGYLAEFLTLSELDAVRHALGKPYFSDGRNESPPIYMPVFKYILT